MPDDKIAVQCPGCKAKFRAPPQFAGKKAKCPKCQTILTIPAPKPPEPEPVPEPEPEPVAEKEAPPQEGQEEPAAEEADKAAEEGEEEPPAKVKASSRGGRKSRLAALRSRSTAKGKARGRAAAEPEEKGAEAPKKSRKGLLVALLIVLVLLGGGAAAVFLVKPLHDMVFGGGGPSASPVPSQPGGQPEGGPAATPDQGAVESAVRDFIAAGNAYDEARYLQLLVPEARDPAAVAQHIGASRSTSWQVEIVQCRVTVDADRATASLEVRVRAASEGAPTSEQTGRMSLDLLRHEGRWLVATPQPEVAF